MGQTLTHGVYLPDEGERNCYNGLAANWSILDGAVGTVAEHTSALAGKAPLVHTHSKSDITDFPAYGNTAGTICEGNDSRLSDARTPVAHTHTKSDVTDLLNSNFIPSANNTYNLGSSSYQWNNLYAKNYYYNGTAWGLDKVNEWTDVNKFTSSIQLQYLQSGGYSDIRFLNENNVNECTIRHYTGNLTIGKKYQSASAWWAGPQIIFNDNGTVQIKSYDGTESWTVNFTPVGVYPTSDKTLELGTSTHKWKTLNGINPGALSLPTTDTSKLAYFSSDITDLTGGLNTKTFALDGWITIFMPNVSGDFIAIDTSIGQVISVSGTGVGDVNIGCICPVRAGITNRIFCKCSSALTAAFSPCAGSV